MVQFHIRPGARPLPDPWHVQRQKFFFGLLLLIVAASTVTRLIYSQADKKHPPTVTYHERREHFVNPKAENLFPDADDKASDLELEPKQVDVEEEKWKPDARLLKTFRTTDGDGDEGLKKIIIPSMESIQSRKPPPQEEGAIFEDIVQTGVTYGTKLILITKLNGTSSSAQDEKDNVLIVTTPEANPTTAATNGKDSLGSEVDISADIGTESQVISIPKIKIKDQNISIGRKFKN